MSYLSPQTSKRRTGSPELMDLLVSPGGRSCHRLVAGHQIGMDLSSVTSLVSVPGLTETDSASHGGVGFR
jgi:hypothetical protein